MTSGQVFCIFMIGTGAVLLVIVVLSLAKRRMTEPFCLAWGLFALLLLLAGCLLHPTELDRYISVMGMLMILFLIYSILVSAYALSRALSVLIRKNRELAVQVSILNAETERLSQELEALAERADKAGKTGQKRTGQKQTWQKQTGQKRTGQRQTGQKQTEQKRTGQKQTEQKRTGQKQTWQKQTGQKQTG